MLPAIFGALYASSKGYMFLPFLAVGLIFSVFPALLIAFSLPNLDEPPARLGEPAATLERPHLPALLLAAAGVFIAVVVAAAILA